MFAGEPWPDTRLSLSAVDRWTARSSLTRSRSSRNPQAKQADAAQVLKPDDGQATWLARCEHPDGFRCEKENECPGKVTLADNLAGFEQHFSPKIVGHMNDYKLAVVKAKGEFAWHTHEDTDDFFLVKGRLTIQLRDHVGAAQRGRAVRGAPRRRALPKGRRGGARPADRASGRPNTGDPATAAREKRSRRRS